MTIHFTAKVRNKTSTLLRNPTDQLAKQICNDLSEKKIEIQTKVKIFPVFDDVFRLLHRFPIWPAFEWALDGSYPTGSFPAKQTQKIRKGENTQVAVLRFLKLEIPFLAGKFANKTPMLHLVVISNHSLDLEGKKPTRHWKMLWPLMTKNRFPRTDFLSFCSDINFD